MNPQEPNPATAVEVWSRDSILYSDHPARRIGPWPADPTRTLLQLGESGPGLLVVAATVAGRYVVSLPTPQEIEESGMTVQALYSRLPSIPALTAEEASKYPGIEAIRRRAMIPVGIVYAGPPCQWAVEQIMKVFGEGARTISHADATAEQLDHVRMATGNPESHATIYVGVTAPDPGGFDYDDVEAGLDLIAEIVASGLFVGTLIPEPEQIEQAVSRIGSGELAVLVPPPVLSV